jgi:hypothetical protein
MLLRKWLDSSSTCSERKTCFLDNGVIPVLFLERGEDVTEEAVSFQ